MSYIVNNWSRNLKKKGVRRTFLSLILTTGLVFAQSGGDSYGYQWTSSDDAGGPTYSWVDIVGYGGPLALSGDDNYLNAVPIGFNFPFYGNTYNSFGISTNGFIVFSNLTDSYPTNQNLPNTTAPGNMLAVFWDDLAFMDPTTAIDENKAYSYYDTTNGRYIIEFWEVPLLNEQNKNTFEIILYTDGTIVYQYQTMNGDLTSATVGWQNSDGTDGHTIVNNLSFTHNNMAIQIEYSDAPRKFTAANGDEKVTLNWKPADASSLHGYYIYRGTSSNPTTAIDSIVTGTPRNSYYIDLDLTNGTKYYYRSRSKFTDGTFSDYTKDIAVTPGIYSINVDGWSTDWQNIRPVHYDAVGDVGNKDLDSMKIYVNDVNFYGTIATTPFMSSEWISVYFDTDMNSSTGYPNMGIGAEYRLKISPPSGYEFQSWESNVWNTNGSADVSMVSGNTEQFFEFHISLEELNDPTSISFYFETEFGDKAPDDDHLVISTQKVAPEAPTGLSANANNQKITLRWNQNSESDLHKYNIYRNTTTPVSVSTQTLMDSVVAASPPDTFYTDGGLTNNQTYYYLITAVNNSGRESAAFDEINVTPNNKHEQVVELLHLESSSTTGGWDSGYPDRKSVV